MNTELSLEYCDNDDDNNVVYLILSDNNRIPVKFGLMKASKTITSLCQDVEQRNPDGSIDIYLPEPKNVIILQNIITFLQYHFDNRNELNPYFLNNDKNIGISTWDYRYCQSMHTDKDGTVPKMIMIIDENNDKREVKDFNLLIDTLNAANYLDIKSLVMVICRYIAINLKDKNDEEMREWMGLRPGETIGSEHSSSDLESSDFTYSTDTSDEHSTVNICKTCGGGCGSIPENKCTQYCRDKTIITLNFSDEEDAYEENDE